MRNKNLFTFFLIFLCFCFTNCSDDEKQKIYIIYLLKKITTSVL